MQIFYGCRGRVAVVSNGNTPKGFFSLKPPIDGTADSPVLLHYATVEKSDIVVPQTTLSGTQILYRFGQQFGRVQIAGSLMLGTQESGNGESLKALEDWFEQNRVSNNETPITLSMPGKNVLKIHVVGMSVGAVDQETHVQQFYVTALAAKVPPAGGAGGAPADSAESAGAQGAEGVAGGPAAAPAAAPAGLSGSGFRAGTGQSGFGPNSSGAVPSVGFSSGLL